MCEAEKKSTEIWIDSRLPKITEALGCNFDNVKYELSVPGDSLYLSNTWYINIHKPDTKKRNSEEIENVKIIVKRPPQNEIIRQFINADKQFHNEILFYAKYAKGSNEYPRSIYLEEKPPSDTVIVLEDVTSRGYELCPWKYNVPLEYTLAAMREIGRFHGRGYVMKEQEREKFFEIVSEIQETRYYTSSDNTFKEYINLMSTRAIEYLRGQNYDKRFCDKMEAYLKNCYDNIMMWSVNPVEPLAVICHGDFTMNNSLFKKEGDTPKAMLIDFALLRYGSPAIDLSTFFCLCCPWQLNKDEFHVVLKEYHKALKEYLAENGIVDDPKYTYEAFFKEHKERGLFGFVIASFYLAVLMGKCDMSPEDVFKMGTKKAASIARKMGGDEVSNTLASTLLKLKELGCLDHIL